MKKMKDKKPKVGDAIAVWCAWSDTERHGVVDWVGSIQFSWIDQELNQMFYCFFNDVWRFKD